jgi:hypothetical protein
LDFSWVKQLADQSNQVEIARQDKERRDKEDKKTAAMATAPFVEKLFVVISGATEEFNKHCMFPHLRVQIGKFYKHSRTDESPTAEPDEVAHFGFVRRGFLYGVRGVNGAIEFIQMPVGDSSALNLKLHELGVGATYRMEASVENATKKVRWLMDGAPLDGPAIVSLCQKFFVDLIQRTNVEEDTDSRNRESYH